MTSVAAPSGFFRVCIESRAGRPAVSAFCQMTVGQGRAILRLPQFWHGSVST